MSAPNGTDVSAVPPSRARLGQFAGALAGVQPIYVVCALLLGLMFYLDSSFAEPRNFLTFFLKPAVPLILLAIGQLFVIVAGGFDLSVGALVTFCAVLAAEVIDGNPSLTYPVIGLLFLIGLIVGLVNGTITTRLGVPSFITTLGTLLVLNGAALLITNGAASGELPDNFRQWGRSGFEDVPLVGQLPYACLVLIPAGLIGGYLLHRTRYGSQVFAVGGNARASGLSGVPVKRVRTLAFVVSALFATTGAVLLAGFTGVSPNIGEGLEFQSIAAVVFAGAVLGGGRGSVPAAIAGAVSLAALFTVLNLLGYPQPLRLTVQGLILIGAVALTVLRRQATQ